MEEEGEGNKAAAYSITCPAYRLARVARLCGSRSPCASVPSALLAPGAAGGARPPLRPGCVGRELGATRRPQCACTTVGHGQPAVVPARGARCDETWGLPADAARHAQPARCWALTATLVCCLLGITTAKVCDSSVRFSPDDACNIQIDAGPHGALGMRINWTSAVAYPR